MNEDDDYSQLPATKFTLCDRGFCFYAWTRVLSSVNNFAALFDLPRVGRRARQGNFSPRRFLIEI